MIEDGWLRAERHRPDRRRPGRRRCARSRHDPTLRHQLVLRDGRRMTAVQLQMEYLEQARKHVEDRLGSDADAQTRDVLDRWESVLDRLATDPMSLSRELDWVAKLAILEGYREREGLGWDAAKLHLVDLQYSDVRPGEGPVQPAGRPRPHGAPAHRGRGAARPSTRRRRTPARTSAAPAWRASRRRSRRRRGTRSSSTSAASRCSGSRRSSRCAGPRRTSARCSTPPPPRSTWSRRLTRR